MSSAPVELLPGGRCPLCGARNRDDAQWCVQCLARFGVVEEQGPDDVVAPAEHELPDVDDGVSGSRRGAAAPVGNDDPTGGLPRPRRDRDDADAGAGSQEGSGETSKPGQDPGSEQVNRLMAQLAAHEAQRPWGSQGARQLGFAGRPAVRAAVGAAAVLAVVLLAMWVLGHFV